MSETNKDSVQKIRSLKDLQQIKEAVRSETALREDGYQACVTIHMGTCGIASGAREIIDTIMETLSESGRQDVRVTTSGCIGACSHEPVITVDVIGGDSVLYGDLDPDKARKIIQEHVLAGKPVSELAITKGTGN